jgi:hypothetical protein
MTNRTRPRRSGPRGGSWEMPPLPPHLCRHPVAQSFAVLCGERLVRPCRPPAPDSRLLDAHRGAAASWGGHSPSAARSRIVGGAVGRRHRSALRPHHRLLAIAARRLLLPEHPPPRRSSWAGPTSVLPTAARSWVGRAPRPSATLLPTPPACAILYKRAHYVRRVMALKGLFTRRSFTSASSALPSAPLPACIFRSASHLLRVSFRLASAQPATPSVTSRRSNPTSSGFLQGTSRGPCIFTPSSAIGPCLSQDPRPERPDPPTGRRGTRPPTRNSSGRSVVLLGGGAIA